MEAGDKSRWQKIVIRLVYNVNCHGYSFIHDSFDVLSDLSLGKNAANVCAAGFFRLRQLRRI